MKKKLMTIIILSTVLTVIASPKAYSGPNFGEISVIEAAKHAPAAPATVLAHVRP